MRERAPVADGRPDALPVGGEAGRDDLRGTLRKLLPDHERGQPLTAHGLGRRPCLVVGDQRPALGLLLVSHRPARGGLLGGRGGGPKALRLGVAEVVAHPRLAVPDGVDDCAAAVQRLDLLRLHPVSLSRADPVQEHVGRVIRVVVVDELEAAGGEVGLDRLAGALLGLRVACALRGVLELRRHERRDLDQLGPGPLVVELGEDGRLVERQVVLLDRGRGGGVLRDGDAALDLGRLRAGAAGDVRHAQPLECELLERGHAVGGFQLLALVVLDHLLHDALCGRLVRVDDVDRNRGHARLPRSKSPALPGPHEHVSVLIPAREHRRDDAAGLDALDELSRQRRAGSHVRLDDQSGRVDVLDDPAGSGGVLDDAHGFSLPFNRFFCLSGKRIDRERECRSAREVGRNKGACDRVRLVGHAGTERTTMTGRTDEKTGGQRRVAAPGAGTASSAGPAGAGAPAGARVGVNPNRGYRNRATCYGAM